MKTSQKMSLLAVLFASVPLWGSNHSAADSTARPEMAPPIAPQEIAPATASQVVTPAQLMQMKMQNICARADKNLDGYISRIEFTTLRKTDTAFKTTDSDRDGRLSLHECVRALGIS
jgi:hypothetical protein